MTLGVGAFSEAPLSADRVAAGGGSTANSTLSSSGIATVAFVGSSLTSSTLSISSVSTNSFAGSSLNNALFSSSGRGVGSFVGLSLNSSTLSATGSSLGSFVGSSIAAGSSVLSVTGTSLGSFAGASLVNSILSSNGGALVSFISDALGITTTTKGGAGRGSNLTLKQKKKLKQVVNQEWLKAEQTVQELLLDRLGHAEPAKVKIEKLTASKSLVDVIEALKALSKETVTLPEQQAVIKTINKTIVDKTTKPAEKVSDIEERMAKFEKRLVDIEEMVLVVMSEIM